MISMRATRSWIEENCPLTFEQLRKYRYSNEEIIGYILGTRFSSYTNYIKHIANTLELLQVEHGDVAVNVTSERVDFIRYRSQDEVSAHETELENAQGPDLSTSSAD
jgi:hypothetical protein